MPQCYKGSCCPLPKNVRPCTFFGFEFAVQTRTIIPGGHPVRPWFQSCDVLGDEPKTRRPKSALQTLGMPLSGSFEDGWGCRGGKKLLSEKVSSLPYSIWIDESQSERTCRLLRSLLCV